MKIIGLDPGGTTGTALYDLRHDSWERRQIVGEHHNEALWKYLVLVHPDIVVCESFIYQQRTKVDLRAVEYIGVARLYCQINSMSLIEQPPAMKAFWDDDKLKAINLWVPGSPHACDATRHVLQFLTFKRGMKQWIQLLKG